MVIVINSSGKTDIAEYSIDYFFWGIGNRRTFLIQVPKIEFIDIPIEA